MLLYLLKRDTQKCDASHELDGCYWRLEAHDLEASTPELLQFSCISYSWGTKRVPSPFNADFEVSDRTAPALATFNWHRPSCKYVWIDAFCVPSKGPERALTLESMGYIYSRAEEVIAILSNGAGPALEQMNKSDFTQPDQLATLEKEEWISRAWTYQEAVNSRSLYITCEQPNGTLIAANDFLNRLSYTLSRLEGSSIEKRKQFPRMDAFEDLIADYMISGYQERSALQVMSNMDGRTQGRPEDHFYAMIGAISTDLSSSSGTDSPCEAFMSLCERKGDYSFIYSAAKRDLDSSRRWRPVPGDLPSILRWHTGGKGQPGHVDDERLYLDQMVVVQESPLDDIGKHFIERWLAIPQVPTGCLDSELHLSTYDTLQKMGFNGSSEYISTAKGYFFPFQSVHLKQDATLLVSTSVQWVFGAPGLACYYEGDLKFYTPGVFVGRVDESFIESVRLD
jgi:hypothetical protein